MATAQLFLSGARVTPAFREALHDAANRAGITPNEFVITAAAEKLAQRGASFPGVFRPGDMPADRRYRELCHDIAKDFGGETVLTEAERQIVRQAALVKIETDRVQAAVLRGEPVDAGPLNRLVDTLDRLTAQHADATGEVAA